MPRAHVLKGGRETVAIGKELCFGRVMQTRKSLLVGDRPQCPVDSTHRVDRHGKYARCADCQELTKSKWIPRFACRTCWRTISVLPDDMLPYRPIPVSKVQSSFDAKASGKPEPPATEVEGGCLKRAWHRFSRRLDALTSVLGQMMQTRQSTGAKRIWIQLRRLGSLEEILRLLARKYKTSLLADYLCLKPWVARPNPGG